MFAMPEVKIAALVMNYDRSTVCGSSTLFLFSQTRDVGLLVQSWPSRCEACRGSGPGDSKEDYYTLHNRVSLSHLV